MFGECGRDAYRSECEVSRRINSWGTDDDGAWGKCLSTWRDSAYFFDGWSLIRRGDFSCFADLRPYLFTMY